LAIFSFTLLLNCVDLNAFDTVLKLILIIFLSQRNTVEYKRAHDTLLKLINERPMLLSYILLLLLSYCQC
jgi:hypothetical protein